MPISIATGLAPVPQRSDRFAATIKRPTVSQLPMPSSMTIGWLLKKSIVTTSKEDPHRMTAQSSSLIAVKSDLTNSWGGQSEASQFGISSGSNVVLSLSIFTDNHARSFEFNVPHVPYHPSVLSLKSKDARLSTFCSTSLFVSCYEHFFKIYSIN